MTSRIACCSLSLILLLPEFDAIERFELVDDELEMPLFVAGFVRRPDERALPLTDQPERSLLQ